MTALYVVLQILVIFETLGFAGYLSGWNPNVSEKPMAYIVILCNKSENKWYTRDASFAAENIMITAESYDIGSCVLCNIKRNRVKEILDIPDRIIVDSIVVLGYKKEHPKVVDYKDSVKYFHDKNKVLNVPKKSLKKITHINKYKI